MERESDEIGKRKRGGEEKGVRRRWRRCEALPVFRLVRGKYSGT